MPGQGEDEDNEGDQDSETSEHRREVGPERGRHTRLPQRRSQSFRVPRLRTRRHLTQIMTRSRIQPRRQPQLQRTQPLRQPLIRRIQLIEHRLMRRSELMPSHKRRRLITELRPELIHRLEPFIR